MKKFDSINIIPFVDIMLVLLAIVLTTSTLVQKNLLPVSLPQSSSQLKHIDRKTISITVKKDGELVFEKSKVTKDELLSRIKELRQDDEVVINCDKDARFENFVFVLDSLKKSNLENLSIVTKE